MKWWMYIIVGLILASCGAIIETYQDNPYTKTRYYDKDGNYQGYSIQRESGKTRYYDKNGKYRGFSSEEQYKHRKKERNQKMDFNKCVICGLYDLDEELNIHICKLMKVPVNEVEKCDPPHLKKEDKNK